MKQQTSEKMLEKIKLVLGNPSGTEDRSQLVKVFCSKASASDPKIQALYWYHLFEALEVIGRPSVDSLVDIVRDSHYPIRFRINAVNSLSNIGGSEAVAGLIEALYNNDFRDYFNDRCVNVTYLLRKASKSHIPNLLFALPDWHYGPQVLIVLEELGWLPLTDLDKIHYYIACRDGKALLCNFDNTRRILLDDVKSGNTRKVENAVYAFVGIGREEILQEIVEILEAQGTKDMAIAFLNCGNKTLAEAARSWAYRHGYTIIPGGPYIVGWGSMLS